MSTDDERAKIIAASGSGGSAQGYVPSMVGTLKFGEHAFGQVAGGPVPELRDDEGNVLVPARCGKAECVGSHVWLDGDVRSYCEGPNA